MFSDVFTLNTNIIKNQLLNVISSMLTLVVEHDFG